MHSNSNSNSLIIAPSTSNETERLLELYHTELLDSSYETEFDDIVLLASRICNVPISLISLIDANRQWFKAKHGIDDTQTDRDVSFCSHAILKDDIMEIPDAAADERFSDNPLVVNNPNIRFYAGVPLVSRNGYKLGTLCVIDTVPRNLDKEQLFALKVLATQAMKLIELRVKNKELRQLSELQNKMISITAHDVRNPLSSLHTLIGMQETAKISPEQTIKLMPVIKNQLDATLGLLNNLVDWGKIQMNSFKRAQQKIMLYDLVQDCLNEIFLGASLKCNILLNNTGTDTVVTTDKHGLQFILRNLVGNANKFTENGTITVDHRVERGRHYISISDTGTGILINKLNPLNNTELKSSDGTQKEKGSGLGLTLIREQLQQMNGSIDIQSEIGVGTTVTISF